MIDKITHESPFSLAYQNEFFGSWPVLEDGPEKYSIVMAFPVEGWKGSAAVVVSETKDQQLTMSCEGKDAKQAISQARACLSLNVDDSEWKHVGSKDRFMQTLLEKYHYLRPSLFHSPYEAAAGFIIGARISIKQRQAMQARMAQELGEKFKINGLEFSAFPSPQKLLSISEFRGLNPIKLERLHGVAQAAIDGKLNRLDLLAMDTQAALTQLQSLNGIGPFYASGILYRGAGVVDEVTDDSLTKYAVKKAYNLDEEPTQAQVLEIAQNWRPYRMWCEVLLHVWLRREVGMPKKNFK